MKGVRVFSIFISACSRSTARSTTWSIVGDGAEAGTVLADAATGCGAAFGGCGSGCKGDEAALSGIAEAGVCAVAGDENASADSCAFALLATVAPSKTASTPASDRREDILGSFLDRTRLERGVVPLITPTNRGHFLGLLGRTPEPKGSFCPLTKESCGLPVPGKPSTYIRRDTQVRKGAILTCGPSHVLLRIR